MFWKNWPSWLKGGIVGLAIAITLLEYSSGVHYAIRGQLAIIFSFANFSLLALYFIIGSLIGLIINLKWSYWIKSFFIILIVFIHNFFFTFGRCYDAGGGWICKLLINNVLLYILYNFTAVLLLLGCLIGWIIGKIKSKKQQPVQTQPQVQTK